MKSTGIVNATPCYYNKEDNSYYISADEYKSLSQWFPLFDEITWYKPITGNSTKTKEWMKVPHGIKVVELCGEQDKYADKISKIKQRLKNKPDVDVLYYRLPSFEPAIFHHYAKKYGIPYFTELHGDIESAVMSSQKPYLIKKPLSIFFRHNLKNICRKARFSLTIGPALMDKYVNPSIDNLVVTNHLMSIEDYPSEIKPKLINSEEFHILFVGHIHERKGLRYLFEALSNLKRKGLKFKLTLAGRGNQKDFLESYAEKNGFKGDIHFLGQVKHGEDLFALYQNADLFILPSIAAEGVPRVTHEAMALGCPIVATDIGSVKWQLSDGVGIVVKPASADDLERAIVKVYEDDKLRQHMIEKGYQRSLDYTIEKQAERIRKFVEPRLNKLS